jgi:AcrR family transcriptional regulator
MSSTPLSDKAAHSEKGEHTRQQILDVAQRLFAEKGFRGAAIRDIVKAAGSNVAAVNYHFGSKENLYREVWRRHKILARERGLAAIRDVMEETGGKPELETVLEAYVTAARKDRDPTDRRNWMMLINGELAEPRLDPRVLIDEIMGPIHQGLGDAIAAACPGLSAKAVRMSIHSLLAQLMHVTQLQIYFDNFDTDELPMMDTTVAVDHIVRFTSAGIRALQEQNL